MRANESNYLKARGNLTYLEFLRVVNKLWEDAHPGIPLIATTTKSMATYPCITYRLDLRKPHPSEPKPRFREEIRTEAGEDAVIIAAQRFQNIITFTVMAQSDPHAAEELIEVFEDFMIEFQPVFKELGVSELVYARRNPDAHDERPGLGISERSASYMLTTEKLILTTYKKLQTITAEIRTFLETNQATPTYGATPNIDILINDQNGTQ